MIMKLNQLKPMRMLASAVLALTIAAAPVLSAFADSEDIYVSLGADLTASQRAIVLNLMDLSENDLAGINVTTITNQMEKETLGSYLPDSVIGSRALSCTKVEKTSSGGIHVTTHNISYCTEGMYQNALITAGVQNADVTVVGPTRISGTAGLVGAMKSYQDMTGKDLSAENEDAAVDELVTTGNLAGELGSTEDAENLIALAKQKVSSEDVSSEDDIANVVRESAEELGISLNDSQLQMIIDLMKKISRLNLNTEQLQEQATNIYNRLVDLGIDMSQYDKEGFINSLTNLFRKISEFFSSLFS